MGLGLWPRGRRVCKKTGAVDRAPPILTLCPDTVRETAWARRLQLSACLLYTSAAAVERSSVDLGGRRII